MSASPYMPENDLTGNNVLVFGYSGAYCDPVVGGYSLGNGYRAYLPELMCFSAPDGWSPFGKGGLNPYLYGSGDPINHSDPSGHLSTLAWIGIGGGALGIAVALSPLALAAIGAIGTELTVGAAAAIATQEAEGLGTASFFSAMLGEIAGLISAGFEDSNKTVSNISAGVSIGLAVTSLGFGLAGSVRYLRRLIPTFERAVQTERELQGQIDVVEQRLRIFSRDFSAHIGRENLTTQQALDVSEGLQVPSFNQSARDANQPHVRILFSAEENSEKEFVTDFPDQETPRTNQSTALGGQVDANQPGPSTRRADPSGASNTFPDSDDLEINSR